MGKEEDKANQRKALGMVFASDDNRTKLSEEDELYAYQCKALGITCYPSSVASADTLATVLNRAKGNDGFLTMPDIEVIAKEDRLRQILVRCNNCRFLAAAQDISWLVGIIQRDGSDYVRDISFPAKNM